MTSVGASNEPLMRSPYLERLLDLHPRTPINRLHAAT
jgi:hypothetical protein